MRRALYGAREGPRRRTARNVVFAVFAVVVFAVMGDSVTMRYDERPTDDTPVDTDDLPPTPVRDRNIPATAWRQAPVELLELGSDLPGAPVAEYKRRIGPWLLWRAGPARGGDARYWVGHVDEPTRTHTFRLHPDGSGSGCGPSGAPADRFRTWKEDLRDHP